MLDSRGAGGGSAHGGDDYGSGGGFALSRARLPGARTRTRVGTRGQVRRTPGLG